MEDTSKHAEQVLRDVLHARHTLGDPAVTDDQLVVSGQSPFHTAEDVAGWWEAQHDHVLAVIQSVIAAGDGAAAAALQVQVWPVVPADAAPDWCARLRDCGKQLAAELPTSRVLADAFRHSVEACIRRGDYRAAELDGMRELAIWRKLDDYAGAVDALTRLADTYRGRDRLHRVIDCGDEVLSWSLRHQEPAGVVAALRNLGLLMVEVGKFDLGLDYLTRARDALDAAPEVPIPLRAEVIVQLGRAHWIAGAESRAKRRFSDALAMVVDVDDLMADRIRALLATPIGTPLPESVVAELKHV